MVIPRTYVNFPNRVWALFAKMLLKGQLVSGRTVAEFEKEFSSYIGTKYAITVPSGRIGLYFILKGMGLKSGDEVILPSYNSPIVLNILRSVNVKPIFVDVEQDTLNINTKQFSKKITKKTKAIIVLHVGGNPCELDKIIKLAKRRNLYVIEDCAHSIGSEYKNKKVGSLGDAAFFSFGIGKSINTLGGGMVTTNHDKIARKIRKLSNPLKGPKNREIIKKFYFAKFVSFFTNPTIFSFFIYPVLMVFSIFNIDILTRLFEDQGTSKIKYENLTRFSNFQSMLGINQLETIEPYLKQQRSNADFFIKNIKKGVEFQKSTPKSNPSYFHFIVLHKDRKHAVKHLLRRGVDTQVSWLKSLSPIGECPISDTITRQSIYIPIHHNLTKKQIKYVANILKSM